MHTALLELSGLIDRLLVLFGLQIRSVVTGYSIVLSAMLRSTPYPVAAELFAKMLRPGCRHLRPRMLRFFLQAHAEIRILSRVLPLLLAGAAITNAILAELNF